MRTHGTSPRFVSSQSFRGLRASICAASEARTSKAGAFCGADPPTRLVSPLPRAPTRSPTAVSSPPLRAFAPASCPSQYPRRSRGLSVLTIIDGGALTIIDGRCAG